MKRSREGRKRLHDLVSPKRRIRPTASQRARMVASRTDNPFVDQPPFVFEAPPTFGEPTGRRLRPTASQRARMVASRMDTRLTPPPIATSGRIRRKRPRSRRRALAPGAAIDTIPMELESYFSVPPPEEMIVKALLTTNVPPHQIPGRIKLAEMLATNPTLNFCNFDYVHADMNKHFAKDSASETSIFFTRVKNPPQGHSGDVAVKVAYKTTDDAQQYNNSLPIEHVNYMLMNQIILNNWTPHILAYVASFGCDVDTVKFGDEGEAIPYISAYFWPGTLKPGIIKDLEGIENPTDYDQTRFEFLMTEKATNFETLSQWLKKPHRADRVVSVLFQILYTFEVFNRLGFRHNDAHLGNVLIEDWSHDQNISRYCQYNVDGKIFTFETRTQFVKLFDFDRSFFNCDRSKIHPQYSNLIDWYEQKLDEKGINTSNCSNTYLDDSFCDFVGACSHTNPKYDTFLTFWNILDLTRRVTPKTKAHRETLSTIGDWIAAHISGASKYLAKMKTDSGSPDFSAFLVDNPDSPSSDIVPTDDEMSSTLQMLHDPIFEKFSVKSAKASGPEVPKYSLPLAPL